MELTNKQLIEYMENVAKLETSVYEQKESYNKAKARVVYKAPERSIMDVPNKEIVPLPDNSGVKRAEDSYTSSQKVRPKMLGVAFLFLAVGLLGIVIGPVFLKVIGVFVVLVSLLLFSPNSKNRIENEKKKYEQQLQEYDRKQKEVDEEYAKKLAEYEIKKKAADAEFAEKEKRAKADYDFAKQIFPPMETALTDTEKLLKEYYDLDVVFPKYRNMIAVCTMCEYLQTGRCSELTGPNGAYNLYESELRQNLIINRLEAVVSQLEQIKTNQYYLYNELQTANKKIARVSGQLSDLYDVSRKNLALSEYTAYCAEITAANTTATAYLAALK